MAQLHETLQQNTTASALSLKELLGTIRMEPVLTREEDPLCDLSEKWKPYYVTHTKIQTLALLNEYKGSNWSHWWR